MCRILLFGGTTEGNRTAEFLADHNIETMVCVATEYGATRIKESCCLHISSERMDRAAIETFINAKKPELVLDATHPYAREVTANIKAACAASETEYMRLLRDAARKEDEAGDAVFVNSVEEAVEYLSHTEGIIFAATGSKELYRYTAIPDYENRVIARVLSTAEVVAECAKIGFQGKNLICLQGPFSKELNVAMLKDSKAKYLVTKITGKQGGYEDKLRAAREAGCTCVIIGREEADNEEGLSFYKCRRELCKKFNIKPLRNVALVGIGMDGNKTMTGEAVSAVSEAELVIGAERMVKSCNTGGKPVLVEYDSEKITTYLNEHPEFEKIAVLLSGDTGFYSGAKKLTDALEHIGCSVRQITGVSSVSYFMSRIGQSWEDAVIVSNHGRKSSLIPIIRDNRKVFSILGKKDDIRILAEKLNYYGLDKVRLYTGERLSYADEIIKTGYASDYMNYENDALCVVCAVNEDYANTRINSMTRRKDNEFIREKVPMTKYDVRNASITRLNLEYDSICYDIGSGTGSVSIEMAIIASGGHVYGIEKNKAAVTLAEKNKKKFMCDNFTVIEGIAPEAMEGLPVPTHVFIGGSSGNMREIISAVRSKNPTARFVINCIALESMEQALSCSREFAAEESVEISQIISAEGNKIGRYTMMKGENPIYIIAFTGKNERCK